jgi:hypothetical protein
VSAERTLCKTFQHPLVGPVTVRGDDPINPTGTSES